mmetsp:Transcript_122244/g.356837  ORF Transcript_122244/g.356837 Transcript_122244/m.356837 type:complete len:212 (-) Transcript_122244:408-1043(-)
MPTRSIRTRDSRRQKQWTHAIRTSCRKMPSHWALASWTSQQILATWTQGIVRQHWTQGQRIQGSWSARRLMSSKRTRDSGVSMAQSSPTLAVLVGDPQTWKSPIPAKSKKRLGHLECRGLLTSGATSRSRWRPSVTTNLRSRPPRLSRIGRARLRHARFCRDCHPSASRRHGCDSLWSRCQQERHSRTFEQSRHHVWAGRSWVPAASRWSM